MTYPPLQLGVLEHQKKHHELCKELAPTLLKLARHSLLIVTHSFTSCPRATPSFQSPNSLLRSVGSASSASYHQSSLLYPVFSRCPRLPEEAAAPSFFSKHMVRNSSSLFTPRHPSTSAINLASYHQPLAISSNICLGCHVHP